jgi:hypothetical protein
MVQKTNQMSPVDGPAAVSYWCSCDIYRLSLTVFGAFHPCYLRPEAVLTAQWRGRVNLKSQIDGPTTVPYW